jgi:DNA-binding NtrC family response regulator
MLAHEQRSVALSSGGDVTDEGRTLVVERQGQRVLEVPRFVVRVAQGPDQGKSAASVDGRLLVGSAEGLDLQLTDPTVSRYQVELEATPRGIAVRDLGSTNGTKIGTLELGEARITGGSVQLRVGRTLLEVELTPERSTLTAAVDHRFGSLWGASVAMRAVYSRLERAAPTSAPVLVIGETGTGKELAARALHEASERRGEAFEVVDCGGLPPTLIESELFGHARGAFTGAVGERAGAFERAHGGTLFLDEIGELPLDAQPKLLRALAEGRVRPIGGQELAVDVRVVAATNRDLRREVNAGRFRADLYYRLAVIEVRMPALRERLDDLPLLTRTLLDAIVEERGLQAHVELDAETLAALAHHDWPGNVRELRNYLEQLLILEAPPDLGARPDATTAPGFIGDLGELPWHLAKQRLLERFERHYLEELLARTAGNVAEAARRAGVDRGTLFRSMRRLGIRR